MKQIFNIVRRVSDQLNSLNKEVKQFSNFQKNQLIKLCKYAKASRSTSDGEAELGSKKQEIKSKLVKECQFY